MSHSLPHTPPPSQRGGSTRPLSPRRHPCPSATSVSPPRSSATTASCAPRPGTRRSTAPRRASGRAVDRHGPTAFGMFCCSKATNEMNFLAQKFARRGDGHEQHRLAATALDTLLASSVWRRCSGRVAAPAPIEEVEDTDVILLWGSNARETHPIFFHHVLKGDPQRGAGCTWSTRGARPRRSGPTRWLGLDVGTDIALANAMAARSSHAGLHNREFIERATQRLRGLRGRGRAVHARARRARSRACRPTSIRDVAHTYARADRAQICWTLGITEHHNARRQRARADQPRAAHRPRRALRLGPEPAARPEQRAGRRRHGRDPEQAARLPGPRARRRGARQVRARLGRDDPAAATAGT